MAQRLGDRPTFRALKHRNARLFFTGLWVSQVGSWMQTVATALLVKKLAPPKWEGVLLGVAVAAQFVPMLLFGAWFGAFADRDLRSLALEAAGNALQDAGLEAGAVEAFYLGNFAGPSFTGQSHLAPYIAAEAGYPARS